MGSREDLKKPFDFAAIRAQYMDFGVDPRAVDTMSLYEILSTNAAHNRRGKTKVSDQEFEEGMAFARKALAHDPSVRI